ncbi:SPOR domain-containing protein [Candidatus Methylospira mobilis]|uniref:SPOR domain-containing protein n=1 Tax=Candidatus Methylospira mobilis TaxID=1808979 RepID=UPI0028EBCDD6|nr:SPOR domain-containing protein [Candidatus Methylospira mobilis]WNV03127.1 SPOR domain-containing protein [Candidatus Methylospira mobilis]
METRDYKSRVVVDRSKKGGRSDDLDWKRARNRKGGKPAPNRSRWWLILAAAALSIFAIVSLMKWLKGGLENSVAVSVASAPKTANKTIPLPVPASEPASTPKAPEKKPPAPADAADKSVEQQPVTAPPVQPGPDTSASSQKKVEPVKVKPPEPRFTFYKILPDQEVIIPDPDIRMLKQSTPVANVQYTLQVASSLQLDEAKGIQEKLSQIKVKSHIESIEIENALWYRVKVGPFKDLDRADQVKVWLRNNKIDSVVQKKIDH